MGRAVILRGANDLALLGGDGRVVRIERAFGHVGAFAEGHGRGFAGALASDGPVDGAGGLLDGEGLGLGVPGDGPAEGPAVAGAHFTAVHELDAAVWDAAA